MSENQRKAGNLIDSEYENLVGMTKGDLFDYLSSVIPGITETESNTLHEDFGIGIYTKND